MSYSVRLDFENQLPLSLNKSLRAHYHKRRRQNQLWVKLVRQRIGKNLPPSPLQKARIRVVRHSHRMLDFDGCVGSLKPVIDALIECGVIADDSWKVTGAWEVDQVFRKKNLGTLLVVEVFSG